MLFSNSLKIKAKFLLSHGEVQWHATLDTWKTVLLYIYIYRLNSWCFWLMQSFVILCFTHITITNFLNAHIPSFSCSLVQHSPSESWTQMTASPTVSYKTAGCYSHINVPIAQCNRLVIFLQQGTSSYWQLWSWQRSEIQHDFLTINTKE